MNIVFPEFVVASWPFRTGVLVYEPVFQIDIAEWDLLQLAQRPDVLRDFGPALNPLLSYRPRADTILESLTEEQGLLQEMLGTDESIRIEPRLSDDPERELHDFAKEYNLTIRYFALSELLALLERIQQWPAERHHAFVSDWWERFERPASASGPSRFRQESGTDGSLYMAFGSPEQARRMWQEEIHTPLNEFSLWTALRCHWGWRLEFSNEPAPIFPVFAQLESLFSSTSIAQ